MERFDVPLTREMKSYLVGLALANGMKHLRDEVFELDGVSYYPTPVGWVKNITYSYKQMYDSLESQHQELKVMYDTLKAENQSLKDSMREGKTLYKVKEILSSRVDDREQLKQLRKYLNVSSRSESAGV